MYFGAFGVQPTFLGTFRDLRVAEVVAQDIHLAEDGEITFRTKLRVAFKYEAADCNVQLRLFVGRFESRPSE